jgi:hypothetical protein
VLSREQCRYKRLFKPGSVTPSKSTLRRRYARIDDGYPVNDLELVEICG